MAATSAPPFRPSGSCAREGRSFSRCPNIPQRRDEPTRETPVRMTTEEAFIKVLQRHGIEHAFGIIGSAFMPVSDLFPRAGITFWDVANEMNGGLICDGFTRSTGRM